MSEKKEAKKDDAPVEKLKPFEFSDLVGQTVMIKIEGETATMAKLTRIDSFACVFEFDRHIRVIPWLKIAELRRNL